MASAALARLPEVKVATEVWIAAALLHTEQRDREDFTIEEIEERLRYEGMMPTVRPGVRTHIALHCVSNRKANPAKLRMLYATGRNTRRLYRPGDRTMEGRTGRTAPDRGEVPPRYHYLLDWYANEYAPPAATGDSDGWLSGFLAMKGLMKGVWKDESPEKYLRRLRESWD